MKQLLTKLSELDDYWCTKRGDDFMLITSSRTDTPIEFTDYGVTSPHYPGGSIGTQQFLNMVVLDMVQAIIEDREWFMELQVDEDSYSTWIYPTGDGPFSESSENSLAEAALKTLVRTLENYE